MLEEPERQVEEATLQFTLGNSAEAIRQLVEVIENNPEYFPALLALTEVYHSEKRYEEARQVGERALAIEPNDIHAHTSLSRVFMELGDKAQAEHHGAQARMLGWKEQLKEPPPAAT